MAFDPSFRLMRSCAPAAACLAVLAAAPACTRQPTLIYVVRVADPSAPFIDVTLTIQGAPARGLELTGYAARDVMRAEDVRATASNGAPVSLVEAADSVDSGGRRVPIPCYRVAGRSPSTLTLRYRVAPGRREGDEHMGFSGRAFGYLGPTFGLVTGRSLFLVPKNAASFRPARVAFDLPKGWSAVTPWNGSKGRYVAEALRAASSDLLITASIGLGAFRERSFSVGETTVRLHFASEIPDEEVRTSSRAIERVVRYVRRAFGRGLGREYVAVVVPETPERDEIVGEGWALGQGGTMAPLTPERLRRFAQRLIEAYTLHAPFRSEIRKPEEFWLVDAVTNWYSWRAVARAGLTDDEHVGRSLINGYLDAMTTEGVGRDLERLYAAAPPDPVAREILAPFVLFYLDHELRVRERIPSGFDAFLHRVYAGRAAPSLWSLLPGSTPRWEPFRTRYVRGRAVAPVPDLFALAPTRAAPIPHGGTPVKFLTLAYTGNTYGYLENCGCKANQSGGIARRATVLERIRSRDPHALVLDAGNAFPRQERSATPSFLEDREQRFYLGSMDLMSYKASAVGLTELASGVDHFRSRVRDLKTPFLAANVFLDGEPVSPAYRILRASGSTLVLTGVLEPPRAGTTVRGFSREAARLSITDPVDAIRDVCARAGHADLVFVLGRLSPWTIRRVVSACPDVDLVLSTDYDAPRWLENSPRPMIGTEDSTGFVGRTLVLYTYKGQYGLAEARLGVDRSGRIVSADRREHWLHEDVPDHPVVRDRLNRFYDEIGKTELAQASVRPPLAGDPYWQDRPYVGAAVCASCHEPEYEQWNETPHASAFKTLLDRHRHYQPSCISCHVVGFGSEHGYKVGQREDPLGNVQCEVCHGPGADHASDPLVTNIRRAVPEHVCLECHNPEHSDHFVYEERLPKVLHEGPVRLSEH